MNTETKEEREPFTWAQLKEFCNKLTDEQLKQTVWLLSPDSEFGTEVKYASEIGDDHYKFEDEDYSFSKADFDYSPEYFLDGKYKTLEEALANEQYTFIPGTNVHLYDE